MTATQRKNVKEILLQSRGNKCFYCNRPMKLTGNEQQSATIEHVRPSSHGGTDNLSNLRLAHRSCNQIENWLTQTNQRGVIVVDKWGDLI